MYAFISDKRNYECAACGHLFRYKDSVCEDWRDPAKSFLCPKCNAYLEVPEESKVNQIMKYGAPAFVIALCLSVYYSERGFLLVTMFVLAVACMFVQAAPHENIQTKEIGAKNAP
jgi:CXXC-20-CXXC protein